MERTLVILKPGCLQRGLIGEVISRFEKRVARMGMVKNRNSKDLTDAEEIKKS